MSSPIRCGPSDRAIRVLVIEDSPVDRDVFHRYLRREDAEAGFECLDVEHGHAALDRYRTEAPDCVLLDLNLPDVDGLDLLRAILREAGACPVIVTTAYGSEQVAVEAMKAGAADYLVKGSISAESLAHVIRNALETRNLRFQVEQQRRAIEERNRQLELALDGERAARRAVEESESRYRTLAEAMPQVVWTAGHPGGEWDYVNERWTSLAGSPPHKALGYGWLEYLDGADRERVTDAWRTAVARAAPLEVECRFRPAAREPRLQLMRAVPLAQEGRVVKWLGTLTDVEDQRRTEQVLHHRQKLESIGVLAGGVAHDFNNLLVGIIGGVSYALGVLPARHELRPVLEGALNSGDRAAQLTRQLLAYAGKEAFRVEDVEVAQTLKATWELIHASLPRSIELRVAIPPALPPIRTDPAQFQQILMNLILNASEAIPSGRQGLVMVSAGVERFDRPYATWSGDLAPGEYVVLEVRDNGSGIAPALQSRIFDPFFTTKFTGRGLGLAAVQGIVRSNKGSIEVSSAPGTGSVFRVLLPAGEACAKEAVAEPVPAAGRAEAGRILVVDDESVVRDTARVILQRAGHSVETVTNGQEALDVLSNCPDFSLVLLDLNMPGLDGKQTFQAIRRLLPHMPVVICSGYSDREMRSRFQHETVSGFVQKPFQYRTLTDQISELLGPE